MLGHGVVRLAGQRGDGGDGTDEEEAFCGACVLGEVVEGEVGGVYDAGDVDVYGCRGGLGKLAVDEGRVLKVIALGALDYSRIGDDNVDPVVGGEADGSFEEGCLVVPACYVARDEGECA